MTIRYKTTDIGKAIEYMRIHLRDKYVVSGYKLGVEYIVRVSGLEEVKDEPTTEDCSTVPTSSKMEQVDEPQTCSVNGRPYDCGNCEYHKCTADEPQTERSSDD